MAKKQTYSFKTRRNDTVINRAMIVFALLLLAVFALMSVRNWLDTREAISKYETYIKAIRFLPILPICLSVLTGFFFIKNRRENVDERLKVFSTSFLFSVSLVFLVVSFLISRYVYTGYVPAIVFVILVSVLYFIAISFPGSYLVMTVFNAFGAFAIYAFHLVSPIGSPVLHYVLRALAILVALAFIFVLYKAKAGGGEYRGIKILQPNSDYYPAVIAASLFILFTVLGIFGVGTYLIYDIIIALETIIFALFYAIKTLK